MMPKAMFWATTAWASITSSSSAPASSVGGLGHGLHPLAELVLVVQEVGDPGLGVLVLRAPEQGVERAHLDADAAVHAQRVVDVEAVELADLARLAAGAPRRGQLLVALDVDAPVGAGADAQHADRAVVLPQGDHAAGPDRRGLLLVRVLHGVGALGDGAHHRAERDAETLDQAGNLGVGIRTPPSRSAVRAMLIRAMGISTFQAKRCS